MAKCCNEIYDFYDLCHAKIYNWLVLKVFGKSRLIKSSQIWFFLVPLLVKLLSEIEFPIKIKIAILGIDWEIWLALPFSWQFFYFSSVCFALGTTLYGLFCPHIIKNYADFADFKKLGSTGAELLYYFKNFDLPEDLDNIKPKIKKKLYLLIHFIDTYSDVDFSPDEKKSLESTAELVRIIQEKEKIKIPDERLGEAFWYTQKIAKATNSGLRTFIAFLFLIGIVLIIIVLWENFWTVVDWCMNTRQ